MGWERRSWDEDTQRWYCRRLYEVVRSYQQGARAGQGSVCSAAFLATEVPTLLQAEIVDVLLERGRGAFALWAEPRKYVPGEESEGWWEIHCEGVLHFLANGGFEEGKRRLERTQERLREAETYPDLSAWLAALDRGEVKSHNGPPERAAYQLLIDSPRFSEWCDQRRRLEDTWPRLCSSCGHEFRERYRSTQRRCPSCCAKRRRSPSRRTVALGELPSQAPQKRSGYAMGPAERLRCMGSSRSEAMSRSRKCERCDVLFTPVRARNERHCPECMTHNREKRRGEGR